MKFSIIQPLILGFLMANQSLEAYVTVFAHGLGGDKEQGSYYHLDFGNNGFIEGTLKTFNFADYKNPFTSCLGQENDISFLHAACKNLNGVILVGVSRGAATIINYVGTMHPKNIRALVLESPFDKVESITNHLNAQNPNHSFKLSYYPNYNPNGLHPINVVDKISPEIPVLFIVSQADALIPAHTITPLYEKLKSAEHKKVHILMLKHGKHANILWGKEGTMFKNVVHAFYKHYGLPHNPAWALAGKRHFEQATLP